MAGNKITIRQYGKARVNRLLNGLIKQGQSLEPAFAEIGEYLIESHQERFKLEVAPDGSLWEPLAPRTIARKNGDDRILQQSGTMRDTLAYQFTNRELFFGTNMEYGATHQFGREDDGIPARPFLGLSTGQWNDSDEIVAILQDHLLEAIE